MVRRWLTSLIIAICPSATARIRLSLVFLLLFQSQFALASQCDNEGIWLQILGSGGADLLDGQATGSYLVWINGKARILIDTGAGSTIQFLSSGAKIADLDVLLYTNLGADHSADLPALVNASLLSERKRHLLIYGPNSNKFTPSTVTFVRGLFDSKRGVYRHLGNFVSPLGTDTFKLKPHNVPSKSRGKTNKKRNLKSVDFEPIFSNQRVKAFAIPMQQGQTPLLAWRLDIDNKRISITHAASGAISGLQKLIKNSDLLLSYNANPHEKSMHYGQLMSPSHIGRLAYRSDVKQLILTHGTKNSRDNEKKTISAIKSKFTGIISFADDLDCFQP